MKSFVFVVLIAALAGAVVANIAPTPPSYCDFKCTQLDLPTCATNGRCFLQFTGPCGIKKYNCKNRHRAFNQVDQFKCGVDSSPRCQTGDN